MRLSVHIPVAAVALAFIVISGCAPGKEKVQSLKSGDYGLNDVQCPSGALLNFEAEAVSITAAGNYNFRQIYLYPPGDPSAVQCRFESEGTVKPNEGTMRTKFEERTLYFASESILIFRGQVDGEICSFYYDVKAGILDQGSQSAGCP